MLLSVLTDVSAAVARSCLISFNCVGVLAQDHDGAADEPAVAQNLQADSSAIPPHRVGHRSERSASSSAAVRAGIRRSHRSR
jgi:hypothetical protein